MPEDGATGVSASTDVVVTFSENVDPATVTDTSFVVSGVSGAIDVGGAIATFTPDDPLAPSTSFTVTVTTDVTDRAGNALSADFTSSFTTGAGPSADAGPDQDLTVGANIVLDGRGSSDPGGNPLTYAWTQIAGPTVTLDDPTSERPDVTDPPNEVTTLQFELVVTAGGVQSDPDRVSIFVLEDAENALFVSKQGDDANAGTRSSPFATVQFAIDSSQGGADVYVAEGEYTESLTLRADVSVYGGFDAATWVRDIEENTSSIVGDATAISASGANNLTLEGLNVTSADAASPGESSIVIGVANSVNLVIASNTLTAGKGADGTAGSDGVNGATGDRGSNGSGDNGGNGGAGGPGLNGGRGGNGTAALGGGGVRGDGACGGSPGSGGTGTGGNGGPGGAGANGDNGAGGLGFGGLANGSYQAANGVGGGAGDPGCGGGGGGAGGGALIVNGGGGGGGGEGGGGATGGRGGGGGGGSFGIVLTGASSVSIANNTITAGDGGAGASGGASAFGGPGGGGGSGARVSLAADGGAGGPGGVGGNSGRGGSGGGGPTFAIAEDAGSTSERVDNTLAFGTPGEGGVGTGGSGGADGEAGEYKKL